MQQTRVNVSRSSRIQSDLTDPAFSDIVRCGFVLAAAMYNLLQIHCGCLNAVPRSKKTTRQNIRTQHTQQEPERATAVCWSLMGTLRCVRHLHRKTCPWDLSWLVRNPKWLSHALCTLSFGCILFCDNLIRFLIPNGRYNCTLKMYVKSKELFVPYGSKNFNDRSTESRRSVFGDRKALSSLNLIGIVKSGLAVVSASISWNN